MFSFCTLHAQAHYTAQFLHTSSFLDLAETVAMESAKSGVLGGNTEKKNKKPKHKNVNKKEKEQVTQKKELKKPKTKSQKVTLATLQKVLVKKTRMAALKELFSLDAQKKLNMDAKNFASRVYHKMDDFLGRTQAQEGHAHALAFCDSVQDVD